MLELNTEKREISDMLTIGECIIYCPSSRVTYLFVFEKVFQQESIDFNYMKSRYFEIALQISFNYLFKSNIAVNDRDTSKKIDSK